MPRCPQCHETYPAGQFCPKDGTRLTDVGEGTSTDTGRDPLLGQVLADRFRVVSMLGVGGMGTVYEAEHCFIKKRVALKLLRQEITSNPDALARFQREALAASTIGHENIVAIDDFGRLSDGRVYLTMEYLAGQPLNQVIRQGPLTPAQIISVMLQSCHGLAAAHAKGIIHRDMKPENIFLVADGDDGGWKAKILDFGIAKVTRGDTNDTNLTKTGAIFGTPNYMAPEQALGKTVDHRSDVYAMGIILYEMLTGVVPFRSDSFLAILTLHVTKEPDPPSQVAGDRAVPGVLERIAMRAIIKDPALRYQDMGEMVSDLLEARQALLGDVPLESKLRLSKIMPPSSEQPTVDDVTRSRAKLRRELATNPTATAGELVGPLRPPRRRTGLVIGMVVALLAGAGSVALFVTRRGPEPPRVAAGEALPDAADPGPDGRDEGKEQPAPPPAESYVDVWVSSSPRGATILRGDEVVGKTPDVVKVVAGGEVTLTLKREGFKSQELTIHTQKDQKKLVKEVRLVPIHPRRVRRPHRGRGKVDRPPKRRRPVSDHGDHGAEDVERREESSHVDGH